MIDEVREGRRDHEIPTHGTLVRVRRAGGLRVSAEEVASERAAAKSARAARLEAAT